MKLFPRLSNLIRALNTPIQPKAKELPKTKPLLLRTGTLYASAKTIEQVTALNLANSAEPAQTADSTPIVNAKILRKG